MQPKAILVEDDSGMRRCLRRAFAKRGWDVHTSPTPSAALAAAALHQFDVIVLDVMLPEMTGFQLAYRLAALQPQAGVIFISGYPMSGMPESNSTSVLEKPFRTEELIGRADRMVRANRLVRRRAAAVTSGVWQSSTHQ